jgi:hypothetical protein
MAGALTGRMSSLAGDIRRAWSVAASLRDFVRSSGMKFVPPGSAGFDNMEFFHRAS